MSFNGQLHVFTSGTSGNVTTYPTPATPVFSSLVLVAFGGNLTPGTYGYRVSALNAYGEGIAYDEHTLPIASGTTNQAALAWAAVTGATAYNVYGRTPGGWGLLATVTTNSYNDDGTAVPQYSIKPLDKATYVIDLLRHPDPANTDQIKYIHFASPFLGYPYVVAEFAGGDVFHYWLSNPQKWLANHQYQVNDVVQPTTPNGFYYKAMAGVQPVAWSPGVLRTSGDKVQPTKPNNYLYTVTATSGTNPASGAYEPAWPAVDSATITEFTEADAPPDVPAAPDPPAPDPGNGTYRNPAGNNGVNTSGFGGGDGSGTVFGKTPVRQR